MTDSVAAPSATPTSRPRLVSIDVLRGLVMVLMALDHARDFFGLTSFDVEDPNQSTLAWFFTRFVTHFCAPVFVILAGTGAWLKGSRVGPAALSRFLVVRGLWLILIEFLVVNPLFLGQAWIVWGYTYVFAQVIWVLGISMILLAVLSRLPRALLFVFSLVMIFGHNAFDNYLVEDAQSPWGFGWRLLHQGDWGMKTWGSFADRASPVYLGIIYPLIPWLGVMTLGYAIGPWFVMERRARWRRLAAVGLVSLVLFGVLRSTNWYGDSNTFASTSGELSKSVMSFLRVEKYPPSLQYLLVTLGPAALLLILFERSGKILTRTLGVFGSVPMFYYLAHLAVLNQFSWMHAVYTGRSIGWPWRDGATDEPSLALVYGAWGLAVLVLWPMAQGWARLKRPGGPWIARWI